jgi:hypothetical protein
MTEEFDFVESTPAAVPLSEHQFHTEDEHVEETVEEIVEGDDVDVGELDGEHVTVHEEIIDTPAGGFPTHSLTTKDSTSDYSPFSQPSALRFVFATHLINLRKDIVQSHQL